MNFIYANISLPITNPTWIFFLVLCIILLAPLLLSKLRIPNLIGMIMAGILIGEHGFDILARDSSFELFGQVGLYYIMFLAGLEMNMEDFKSIRGKAVVFGLLAFVIPLTLGFFSNILILGYGVVTSVLLASMYASHTLVAYPIVARYGISRHRSVSIAVGATAVTDSLTLLVLAIVGGMYDTGGHVAWYWLILKVTIVGLFIIYIFPLIGKFFLRKYEDGVVQFIFVLAMVFLGAGLMEIAGMEGILGAFFVGLVLNRQIPHVSPLMNRLEFVGNALFIPYFLIGVGMLIDVRVFFGQVESMKVALVMTVMALSTKWIAAWATQKIYGMKSVERELMFGLSNAQAAATLAAVLVGYNIILPDGTRLLGEDVLNGTIVLILITCVISSFTTDWAARKMVLSGVQADDIPKRTDEKIMIPINSPQSVEHLVQLALLVHNPKLNSGLIGLNVMYDDCSEMERAQSKRLLQRAKDMASLSNVKMQIQSRLATNISNGIIHALREDEASEIIAGLHIQNSPDDSFFGPVLLNLINGMNRQIMMLHAVRPINNTRCIHVAIPANAEFEAGFERWVERLARMGERVGCRICFHGHIRTLDRIREMLTAEHPNVRAEFLETDGGNELKRLSSEIRPDHLLVIIMARHGSVSFRPSLEHIPHQIKRYYTDTNFIVLFPDGYDRTTPELTIAQPHEPHESYERRKEWFDVWHKNDEDE